MQLTIDINDSAINKILSFLESLKSDVKIINRVETQEIEAISQEEQNYYEELVHNMSEDDRIVSSKEKSKELIIKSVKKILKNEDINIDVKYLKGTLQKLEYYLNLLIIK